MAISVALSNGFGYIGSTIFALPGVEGLIPNGFVGKQRNNIKVATSKLLTFTPSFNGSSVLLLGSNNLTAWGKSDYSYNYNDNYNYYKDGKSYALCKIGEYVRDSTGRITSFNPKTVFHAADYYDFKQLDDSAAKLDENNTFRGNNTFNKRANINEELHIINTTGYSPSNIPPKDSSFGTIRWAVNSKEGSTEYLNK